jgi:hypothetical protein
MKMETFGNQTFYKDQILVQKRTGWNYTKIHSKEWEKMKAVYSASA